MTTTTADLLVGKKTSNVGQALCHTIVTIANDCLQRKDSFILSLSGETLLSQFLSNLPATFNSAHIDPQWSKWHILVTDEICVPMTSEESNLKTIQEYFLSQTTIPKSQIHGINQDLLQSGKDDVIIPMDRVKQVAQEYHQTVQQVLQETTTLGVVDLAILGFGSDGHTSGLFPGQDDVLHEDHLWVAPIINTQQQQQQQRITMTLPLLNQYTHHVIVYGIGNDKQSVMSQIFDSHSILPLLYEKESNTSIDISAYTAQLKTIPPPTTLPVAMVNPLKSLTWIVNDDAIPTSMGLLSNAVADVIVSSTKEQVGDKLCRHIVQVCQESLQQRGLFTIALSGGSLAGLLSKLPQTFQRRNVSPHYDKWHVVLADERGVPDNHSDSNMWLLQKQFFNRTSIPKRQIHSINTISLSESIQVAAAEYHVRVSSLLRKTKDGLLDLALLGFGPDGHTCSLFPNHVSLQETQDLVTSLNDSPKPPSHRITFTFRMLNDHIRQVYFCGMGDSKRSILHEIFQTAYHDKEQQQQQHDQQQHCSLIKAHLYPKYPCGMVRPKDRLLYFVDDEAMKDVYIAPNQAQAEHDPISNTGPKMLASRGTTLSLLPKPARAKIFVRHTKQQLAEELLCPQIVRYASIALAERNAFTIALSGGSLPSMLSKLSQAFDNAGVDPKWRHWHILLADERCVPGDHADSNMHALQQYLLHNLYEQILHQHIYSLDQVSLAESTEVAAQDYDRKVHTALEASGGMLDLAVLGFGPDGHTCSLFPGHALLQENNDVSSKRWVAPITNSPKPPSHRITLTLPFLNQFTRNVMFCGTGDSKSPILKEIFSGPRAKGLNHYYETELRPKYPCAMIRPQHELVYLVDQSAVPQLGSSPSSKSLDQYAKVLVADSKSNIPSRLHPLLVQMSQRAIRDRGIFTIALSGGSLPALLSSLEEMFAHLSVNPHWDKWHILLADERCVPMTDDDSNLGAIQSQLLKKIAIPSNQIHGIDESLLQESTVVQAKSYETKLRGVLAKSKGMLDVALLGFGPDGHTCSLFPKHELLQVRTRWVAGIDDSPKPPSKRLTLTLGVLNEYTRNVIFCGAGASKKPILGQVVARVEGRQGADRHVRIATNPPPFPCAMVTPQDQLIWVVDGPAVPDSFNIKSFR